MSEMRQCSVFPSCSYSTSFQSFLSQSNENFGFHALPQPLTGHGCIRSDPVTDFEFYVDPNALFVSMSRRGGLDWKQCSEAHQQMRSDIKVDEKFCSLHI